MNKRNKAIMKMMKDIRKEIKKIPEQPILLVPKGLLKKWKKQNHESILKK